MYDVYCLYTLDMNEVFYVGKSSNVANRVRNHRKNAFDPNHVSRDLHRHIRTLATQGVEWGVRVLETCQTDEEARERELFFIRQLSEDGHVLVNRMKGQDRRVGERSVWGFISVEDDDKLKKVLKACGLSKQKWVQLSVASLIERNADFLAGQ